MKRRYEDKDIEEVKQVPLWAQIVGVIGEILITAGVLIGLYIGWQLWFSGWEAEANQNREIEVAKEEWGDSPQKIGKARYDDPPEFTHTDKLGETIGIIYIPAFGNDWRYVIKEGIVRMQGEKLRVWD